MQHKLTSCARERFDIQRLSDIDLIRSYLTPEFADWCVSHYINTSDGTSTSDEFLICERLYDCKYGSSISNYEIKSYHKEELLRAWLAKEYGSKQRKSIYNMVNTYLKPYGIRLSNTRHEIYEIHRHWERVEPIPGTIDIVKNLVTSDLFIVLALALGVAIMTILNFKVI